MIWTIVGVIVGIVIAHAIYSIGYVRGYKAGLAYGMEKLKEFHEYVMAGMDDLKEDEMRKVVIEYHTKDEGDA